MSSGVPPIVLFDGVCNLCDAFVQFAIDRDPRGVLVFASLQSDEGRALLARYGVAAPGEPESIVLIEGGRVYQRSTAALRLARYLTWPWRWTSVLRVVPVFLRDGVYRFIARHRYAWFGKRGACRVPTPELRARFLDARPELQ